MLESSCDIFGALPCEIDSRFGSSVGYAWGETSRLTSKVYPDGSTVHYAYDGAGRPVGISDPFGDTTRFLYDAAGRRTQKRGIPGQAQGEANGLRTDYAYDTLGRLTSLLSFDANGNLAARYAYPSASYDLVGNRTRVEDSSSPPSTPANPKVTVYGYDALDRLSSVDPPDEGVFPANGALTHFAYDATGNRRDFGPKNAGGAFISPHTTYEYDARNRLTNRRLDGAPVPKEALESYDANGNPGCWKPTGAGVCSPTPTSGARGLRYDALGRLVTLTGGFSASYVYDPFGRRIEKTEAGSTVRYQYDGLDVVAEYDGAPSPVLQATYVFGPGIDEVLKIERGATVAAYHTDGLGSIVRITVGGTPHNIYRYNAFGEEVDAVEFQPLASVYRYTGRELDASGLYYYRARYYLASAGRFLTPDPIGVAGGINPYVYVASNPVNFTDPFGLRAGAAFGPAVPHVFTLPQDAEFGIFRASFFIAAPTAVGLRGDDRTYDPNFTADQARASFELNFETGTGRFDVNYSCTAILNYCVSALPINAGPQNRLGGENRVDVRITEGGGASLTMKLTQSALPVGPYINATISITPAQGGRFADVSVDRNRFPTLEIYHQRRGAAPTPIYGSPEKTPFHLFDILEIESQAGRVPLP